MKKLIVAGAFLLASTFLFAGKFWDDLHFAEWPEKEALKLLENSPWAQMQTFSAATPGSFSADTSDINSPIGGTSSTRRGEQRSGDFTVSRQYYVRFQSAKPIRMALAKLNMARGGVSQDQVEEFVQVKPMNGEIVVMLRTAPGQDRSELDSVTTDLLKNNTYLLFKKSKRKVYVERYIPPAEAGGTEGVFLFPRTVDGKPVATLEEEEVRFICELSKQTELNRKFKLKDMVFKGELEI